MSPYFSRERFGSPQFIAGFILLLFLGQCLWFCTKAPLTSAESAFVLQGQQQWHTRTVVMHASPSPITGLIASLPTPIANPDQPLPGGWKWLCRAPFMIMGVLFGASLWYVARRLYGNVAGYIALLLYAFSPLSVVYASTVQPVIIASWGAFGLLFTAIGLAHTLYAPREVVLWNWKRILLLAVALGLAAAAQLSVVLLVPLAIVFMWYLAPERRGAATIIMLAGCAIGFFILLAAYGFHVTTLLQATRTLARFHLQALVIPLTYSRLGEFFLRQPTSLLLLLLSLSVYAVWSRARFFGTTAPLIVFLIAMGCGMLLPGQVAHGFFFLALPFSYVFVSGVMTDLLESKHAPLALGLVLGILLAHAIISIAGLARM
jgi:hypothetical protein